MTSAARQRRRTYIGAPWSRGTGTQSGKMERTKKAKPKVNRQRHVLPLVIKPDGSWAYKFGKMKKLVTEEDHED